MSRHLFTLGLIVPLKEELDEVYRVLPKQRRCPESTGSDYFYDLDSGIPQVRLVASVMGDMGPVAASTRTSRMLQLFQPSVVNVLGIAGALDDECRLGDVVVAREVCEYLKDSKAEDGEEQGAFRFKYSGAHWPLAARFSQAVTNFSHDGPERYAAWKEACVQARSELGLLPNTLLADNPTERLGHVASGDTVGASKSFSVELRGIDRKFLALEMEAAGVARACYENHTDWLVIRGISDFADERKQQLDSTARGGYRKLAARSAAEYLRWFIRWLADRNELDHFFGSYAPPSRPRSLLPQSTGDLQATKPQDHKPGEWCDHAKSIRILSDMIERINSETLIIVIGEGDVFYPWLRRMYEGLGPRSPRFKRIVVHRLSDSSIKKLIGRGDLPQQFEARLIRNMGSLENLCQQKGVSLRFHSWDDLPPYHGFLYGDEALVGRWGRNGDGMLNVDTVLRYYTVTTHPEEMGELRCHFDQAE
jgi:adenosylhomocysteine nucleosidase